MDMTEIDKNSTEDLPLTHAKEWMAKGGDPNIRDERGTPAFYYAINNPPVMELYISNGADVKLGCTSIGGNVLHQTAFWGAWKTTKMVLDAGADPKMEKNDGQTALHCAALMCTLKHINKSIDRFDQMDYAKTMELLLEKGVDANAKDMHGRTPLHLICQTSTVPDYSYHYGDCVAKLLKAGADLNAEDIWEYAPLDYVRDEELAAELIKSGAKFSANYKKHRIARSRKPVKAARPSVEELKDDVDESLKEQEKKRKRAEAEEEMKRIGWK